MGCIKLGVECNVPPLLYSRSIRGKLYSNTACDHQANYRQIGRRSTMPNLQLRKYSQNGWSSPIQEGNTSAICHYVQPLTAIPDSPITTTISGEGFPNSWHEVHEVRWLLLLFSLVCLLTYYSQKRRQKDKVKSRPKRRRTSISNHYSTALANQPV